LLLVLGGCASIFGVHDPTADQPGDAKRDGSGGDDGGGNEAMPAAASPVLLSEIVLAPTAGEFIEIVNTSTKTIDLSTYYLADHGQYFRLPSATPVVDAADFVGRFPAGASLAGHAVATIALSTSAAFSATYGAGPTFSIGDGDLTLLAGSAPSLTNEGEVVVLFTWDGSSDLVSDADIMIAGRPTAANTLMDKSNASQDGPDGDATPSAYKTDAMTITQQANAPASGMSTKRIALETGHETQSGGNGIAGQDETSEDTSATWDLGATAPTPGSVPAELLP
jgi:lamin tail-like protein